MKTLLLLLAFHLPMPEQAQEKAPPVIRGQVVDASDGSAIADADVSLLGILISNGRDVKADHDGHFTFDNIAPGTYTVQADRDGYLPSEPMEVVLDASGSRDVIVRVVPAVTAGTVSGTVRDSDDKPLAGIRVCLERKTFDDFGNVAFTADLGCVVTGKEGRYVTAKVDPGSYFLEAFPVGSYSNMTMSGAGTFYPSEEDAQYATPIAVKDEPFTGADIRMEQRPLWTIRGQIATPSPLSDQASVAIRAHRNGRVVYTTSAQIVPGTDHRSFAIPRLSDGSYDIEAIATEPPLAASAPMNPNDPSRLSTGMSGYRHVDLRAADVEDAEIEMEPDANIRVVVVRPGETLEAASKPQPLPSSLVLPPGLENLALPPGATITLRTSTGISMVFANGAAFTPADLAASKADAVPSLACRYGAAGNFNQFARPGGRTFVLTGVHQEDCLLEVEQLAGDDFVESATLDGEDIWDRVFKASAQSSTLVIQLADGGANVSGRIVDELGKVFTEPTTVILVPVVRPGDHPSANIRFQAGATGAFQLHHIRPGAYYVLAVAGSDKYPYNNIPLLDQLAGQGTPVTLRQGGQETADVVVVRIP